jgi:hypothetical protein
MAAPSEIGSNDILTRFTTSEKASRRFVLCRKQPLRSADLIGRLAIGRLRLPEGPFRFFHWVALRGQQRWAAKIAAAQVFSKSCSEYTAADKSQALAARLGTRREARPWGG